MSFREPTESVTSLSERRTDAINRVACEIAAVGEPVAIRHVNLNGVTIETNVPLRIGTVHLCKFRVDGDVVALSARVVDSRYRPRATAHTIGLEFRRVAPRDFAAAERLVSRILGPVLTGRPAFV